MTLSHILFNALADKLNLEVSLLNKERSYVKNLLNQTESLKTLKEDDYRNLSAQNTSIKKETSSQNLKIMYIVSISFLKANTTIHISDVKGNVKLFYSAGSIGLAGKQKRKRRIAVSKLIGLLIKKSMSFRKKPIALHLSNVNFHKSLIVNKLQRFFYIRVIKSFNQTPYNGCRKKKIRRKKYKKMFK